MERNKWLILNEVGDQYVTIATHWREALLNYLDWIGIARAEKKEIFKKAFVGFATYSEAIEFFNLMYYKEDESIKYMSLIPEDCFCNLSITNI